MKILIVFITLILILKISLVYNLILYRCGLFTKMFESQDYTFDEESGLLKIKISDDIKISWIIENSNIMPNKNDLEDLVKFIIGNIWINLHKYLIQHKWKTWNKLSIINIEEKLKLISIANIHRVSHFELIKKNSHPSCIELIFELISLSSFNNVLFRNLDSIFSLNFSSPTFERLLKSMKYSIKKVWIILSAPLIGHSFFDYKATEYEKILLEYKNEPITNTLYRFLVKSNLIESIEEVELGLTNDFDPDKLFELVSNYESINFLILKTNLIFSLR